MNLPKEEKIKIENYTNEEKIEYLNKIKANKRGGSTQTILDVASPEPVLSNKSVDTSPSENDTSDTPGGTRKIIL